MADPAKAVEEVTDESSENLDSSSLSAEGSVVSPPTPKVVASDGDASSNGESAEGETPVSWSAVKDVGVCFDRNARYRRTMEDTHKVVDKFGDNPSSAYFGVYDGHGGKKAAEFVRDNLHLKLLEQLEKESKVEEALKQAYLATDDAIEAADIKFSGTTTVSALIQMEDSDRVLYCANCGDARAVLSHAGQAVRLTYDHKGADESEQARIVALGGFVVMNRVNGILAVTRSLGDRTMKEYVSGEPYVTESVLDEKDELLILACDGVWDVLSDQEAVDLLLPEIGKISAKKMAERLVITSLRRGSTDNISAIVVVL